ncbi:hypothetical protein CDAR_385411 [Caerostris darwini]|uniref:Uncharacterized protein n=1 Tax=Caerostris darwini TaxID=1538125 RepID=A0AAV4N335_9ARAC|nr:hypothetical protein CDAR_385411 [Caerostris darwini]
MTLNSPTKRSMDQKELRIPDINSRIQTCRISYVKEKKKYLKKMLNRLSNSNQNSKSDIDGLGINENPFIKFGKRKKRTGGKRKKKENPAKTGASIPQSGLNRGACERFPCTGCTHKSISPSPLKTKGRGSNKGGMTHERERGGPRCLSHSEMFVSAVEHVLRNQHACNSWLGIRRKGESAFPISYSDLIFFFGHPPPRLMLRDGISNVGCDFALRNNGNMCWVFFHCFLVKDG